MRHESKSEREAWTRYVDGGEAKVNKYHAETTGKYASKHEASVAVGLWALQRAGKIRDLREQVPSSSYPVMANYGP